MDNGGKELGKYWTHIPQQDEYDQDSGLLLAIAVRDEKTGVVDKSCGNNQLYNLELLDYKKGVYLTGYDEEDKPVYIEKKVDSYWLESQIEKQLEKQKKTGFDNRRGIKIKNLKQ